MWFKIRSINTDISSICEAIKQIKQQFKQNSIPISFVSVNDDMLSKKLDQLDCSFMYIRR